MEKWAGGKQLRFYRYLLNEVDSSYLGDKIVHFQEGIAIEIAPEGHLGLEIRKR